MQVQPLPALLRNQGLAEQASPAAESAADTRDFAPVLPVWAEGWGRDFARFYADGSYVAGRFESPETHALFVPVASHASPARELAPIWGSFASPERAGTPIWNEETDFLFRAVDPSREDREEQSVIARNALGVHTVDERERERCLYWINQSDRLKGVPETSTLPS